MGCTNSKVDYLPAVALCRDRCAFLDEAIRHRFALAESHVAYIHSLREVGYSLHHFINYHQQLPGSIHGEDSPKLDLPPTRKGEPHEDDECHDSPKRGMLTAHHYPGSGHLDLNSDPDDEDGSDFLHHSDHSSPMHHSDHSSPDSPLRHSHHHLQGRGAHRAPIEYMDSGCARNRNPVPYPGGFMRINYMKNKAPPPSIVCEQRPSSPQRIYMGDSYPYPYYGYPNYGGGPGISNGFFGSSPPPNGSSPPAVASSSKSPPPPSPPRASAWDFFNPFETYDKYFSPYTPSWDSKELREEERIPDLEDEDYQHEVVREVNGAQKLVGPTEDGGEENPKAGVSGGGGSAETSRYQTRPSVSMENERMEYEVHVVEKKAVEDERKEERQSIAVAAAEQGGGGHRDVSEVAEEIEVQFVRASESGTEIAKLLEVGKLPYKRKHVSSKMLPIVAPSLNVVLSQPSTTKSFEASSSSSGPVYLEFEEDVSLASRNLSSTLQKLYLWEKKLYNEVKAEEKMRVLHDRKVCKLKRLDEQGAEVCKVDSTRTLIRSLSTKIQIAVQVIDKISVTINKIRDEELWPQLNKLIQGLTRMWKSMLECHQSQCQAIREAKGLGLIRSGNKLSKVQLEAMRRLARDLISLTMGFSSWVAAQNNYVKALNNWLMKCLIYEPEETANGIVPFSPGRIGAPPIFVICNQWSQTLERISENEVIESMRTFTISVVHLWEHDKLEMHRRTVDNKVMEKKVRNLVREDQKIHKEIQALEKKIVLESVDGNSFLISRKGLYQSDMGDNSLQGSLQKIFEAMERFTAEAMKAYEELLQRPVEESGD